MVIEYSAVALEFAVSVTRTAKLDVPAEAGVPDSEPFGLSANPVGSDPDETRHVYGGVPPEAANEAA